MPPTGQPVNAEHAAVRNRAGMRVVLELLLCGLVLLPGLLYPLARDQGVFAYCGQVILDGGLPYQDVYDQKGPATYYTFALILLLFGESTLGIRLFFLLVALFGSQLAAMLGERLFNRSARLPCALCYALVSVQGHGLGPWVSGQVEDIILAANLAAILLLCCSDGLTRRCHVFFAAFLLGLACVFKPTAVVASVAVAAVSTWWLFGRSGLSRRSATGNLLLAMAGFFLPATAFAFYLGIHGALDDFWMFVVEHNLTVYARLSGGTPTDAYHLFAKCWGGLALLALVGISLGRARHPLLWCLLWAVVLGSAGAIVWQWKFKFLYHWTPLVGSLAVFAGVGWAKLMEVLSACTSTPLVRRFATAVSFLLVAWYVPAEPVFLLKSWQRTALTLSGRMPVHEFRGPYTCGSGSAEVIRQVVGYVREHTRPHETVLVWGHEVVVNYLSDRRSPTRFPINRILAGYESELLRAWRKEFLDAIRSRPPKYILVVDDEDWKSQGGNLPDEFQAFYAFLQHHYERETTLSQFEIYRFRDPMRSSAMRSPLFEGGT